ncbi:MAG TPA: tripartite tricarboxylate transporter substrate binding protein [Xanthobacteraceae bacterium]|nr:tripartite tricarboxylate transporter substrate binding protein [Xanthobacteraceae bacterium]
MRKLVILAAALLAAGILGAAAQTYPSRVITMVVPYPAGGPTDTIARILAERMQAALGQSVIVENIGGAGGSIGVGRVAHAPPDGYTLSIGHTQNYVFNPAILKLDYDAVNDFAPISLIADTPIWIVARKSLPADDVNGLIAWLKASNGKATMGTVGIGSPPEFAARIFAKQTATSFQFVPYRGGAPLLQDLIGDHVDFAFGQAAGYLTSVQSGELKAFAVLQPKRWWAAPAVPTLDELGFKNLDVSFWHGLWAPKGTPQATIAKLNGAVRVALADPVVVDRFKKVGQEIWPPEYQTPQALAAKQAAEIARWTPVILAAGIKAE